MARATAKKSRSIRGIITSVDGALAPDPALVIFLRPWCEEDGSVQRRELRVEVPVKNERAVDRAIERWSSGTAVGLSVEMVEKASANVLEYNVARSRLRRLDGIPELDGVREQQARPREIISRVLGKLTLDRNLGWYEGMRSKTGFEYTVCVEVKDPDDDKSTARLVKRAEGLAMAVEKMMPKVREAVASELLDVYNDVWRADGEPLSRPEFKKRHTMGALQFAPGRVTLYLHADELFFDHSVEVRLSPRLKINEVCLA